MLSTWKKAFLVWRQNLLTISVDRYTKFLKLSWINLFNLSTNCPSRKIRAVKYFQKYMDSGMEPFLLIINLSMISRPSYLWNWKIIHVLYLLILFLELMFLKWSRETSMLLRMRKTSCSRFRGRTKNWGLLIRKLFQRKNDFAIFGITINKVHFLYQSAYLAWKSSLNFFNALSLFSRWISGRIKVVILKWYVPGTCLKPLPGTKAIPVFFKTSRQ